MTRVTCLLVLTLAACPNFGHAGKKVLLSSVETLTLYSGKVTTGRRSDPVPQLRCISGKSSCTNVPSTVQCYGKGSDGIDVQWKCEAQLPKNVQFDTLQVQCEGYDYPDDPYVLAGSCGLTYSLKPVGTSSSSSGSSHKRHNHHHHSASQSKSRSSDDGEGVSTLLVVGGFLAVAFAVYYFCLAPNQRHSTPTAPSEPFFDNDTPPPPYSEGGGVPQYGFRPEYTAPGTSGGGGGAKYTTPGPGQQQQYRADAGTAGTEDSGQPGFWTGAAVGGVAGYLFGNRGNTDTGAQYRARDTYSHDNAGSGFAGRDASYSSSGSSASEEPVTRTGYATTRRR